MTSLQKTVSSRLFTSPQKNTISTGVQSRPLPRANNRLEGPSNRPSISRPVLNSFVDGPRSVMTKFGSMSIKRFQGVFYGVKAPAQTGRAKSNDRITSTPACQLKKFYERVHRIKRAEREESDRLKLALESKTEQIKKASSAKLMPVRRDSRCMTNLFADLGHLKKSIELPKIHLVWDLSIECKVKDKASSEPQLESTDERTLTYLLKTLSSILTESVYFKDFFKLFVRYQTNRSQQYRFRCKSALRLETKLSAAKLRSSGYCLFTDYLHNIYMHFNVLREARTRVSYTMSKNILLFTELDRLNLDNKTRQYGGGRGTQRASFNFFTLNKYLKEFSTSVKELNLGGRMRYTEVADTRVARKLRTLKSPTPEIDMNIIQQPVLNIKSANLFQKIVQHTVMNEKVEAKKAMFKKKLKSCFNKSYFFIRRRPNKGSMDIKKSENVHSYSLHTGHGLIDMGKVYRMPKAMDVKRFGDGFQGGLKLVSNQFRLKGFNLSRDSSKTKKAPKIER